PGSAGSVGTRTVELELRGQLSRELGAQDAAVVVLASVAEVRDQGHDADGGGRRSDEAQGAGYRGPSLDVEIELAGVADALGTLDLGPVVRQRSRRQFGPRVQAAVQPTLEVLEVVEHRRCESATKRRGERGQSLTHTRAGLDGTARLDLLQVEQVGA